MNLFNREPALFMGLFQSILVLVVVFGVELDETQTGAILSAAAALLSLIVRQKVTPKPMPPKADG